MIKRDKWKSILSSLLVLLPIPVGLFLWERLPETMNIHWGLGGQPDGATSRALAVFLFPTILFLLHLACIFLSYRELSSQKQNKKAIGIIFWLMPALSLFVSGIFYASALGKETTPFLALPLFLGCLFIWIGNYMPKVTRNRSFGIKIKWTLENDENWYATHRFCGKIWVAGGVLLMGCAFLPARLLPWFVFPILALCAIAPVLYSFLYAGKQRKSGTAVKAPLPKSRQEKIIVISALSFMAVVFLVLGIVMFTGEITLEYGDEAFTVDATYWGPLSVQYDSIELIELRSGTSAGAKTGGFNSAKLLLGSFRNEEFGEYTRYSYTGCDTVVVIMAGGCTLVLSGPDAASTEAIYQTILAGMD